MSLGVEQGIIEVDGDPYVFNIFIPHNTHLVIY